MGVSTHPTGGNRAYKKINNVENQFYSHDIKECHVKQAEFDKRAIDEKVIRHFGDSGLFLGFNFYLRKRKTGKSSRYYFCIRQQSLKDGVLYTGQCTSTSFDIMFSWAYKAWLEYYDIDIDLHVSYLERIKKAKGLYREQYNNLLDKIPNE